MPISLRTKADDIGGNRITVMRFDVPVGEADPAERIKLIHQRTGAVRDERSLPYTQWIAGALNLMPRWYIGSVLRHVDFLASDVPGIPVPVYPGRRPGRRAIRIRPDDRRLRQRHAADLRRHLRSGHQRRYRCDTRLRRLL